jgi:hypothetical protein
LDAAWGVHYTVYYFVVSAAALGLLGYALANESWLVGIVGGLLLVVVQAAVGIWSNNLRMKEVDRLAKLPDWWKMSNEE